jgi:hypothetical protein
MGKLILALALTAYCGLGASRSAATPLQQTSGLVGVFVCNVLGEAAAECGGASSVVLNDQPDAWLDIIVNSWAGSAQIALVGADGDPHTGDDYLGIRFIQTASEARIFYLDSIQMLRTLDSGAISEYPTAVVLTTNMIFGHAFSPADVPLAFSPNGDGRSVKSSRAHWSWHSLFPSLPACSS